MSEIVVEYGQFMPLTRCAALPDRSTLSDSPLIVMRACTRTGSSKLRPSLSRKPSAS